MPTSIEWAQNEDGTKGESWNPVTGCTKVSQGCRHCYAERMAHRMWGARKFTDVRCHEERLNIPLKWRKPRRVFVNSMSDLFHPDVPFEFVEKVWDTMFDTSGLAGTVCHTYQILTKRPERLLEFSEWMRQRNRAIDYQNVWLGVSVEDQDAADKRIPLLLKTPAAVRFLSCEPLLGRLDLGSYLSPCSYYCDHGEVWPEGHYPGQGIDWVIVGGESGPGARPMDIEWARSLRRQCSEAGVAYFMKQLGGYPDKRHQLADLPEDLRVREFPA